MRGLSSPTDPAKRAGARRRSTCGERTRQRPHDETHFSAFEDPPRAHARLSRPHEDGGWSQGPVGPPRQGSRASFGLIAARRLPASYRLRGAAAFETVFRTGARHDAHFLQLIAAPAAPSAGRVGYVIGRKMMRRAVDRNRLRRKLRESVRGARPAIDAFDIILRVRRAVARSDIPAANAESHRLLARLAKPQ